MLSFIYDIVVSRPVTSHTYYRLLQRMKANSSDFKQLESILDVGVGTGTALSYIIPDLNKDVKIIGVDIDQNYVDYCQKLFKTRNNITILLKDFNEMDDKDLKSLEVENRFDVIFFSSSFMLMPNKIKTLEKARSLLKQNGKIYFVLTLFEKRKKLIERFKPLLKYATTIDFGEALTESQFLEILKESGLNVNYKERIEKKYFPCFKIFRYFLIEAEFV